jgi:hypothetical protein
MRHHSVSRLIVAAVLVGAAACASVPVKQRVSESHQSVRQSIVAVDDAERAICAPAVPNTNHCTNPAAVTVGLTDAKHQAFSNDLAQAYAYDEKAGAAIIAWHAGDPVPSDVTQLLTYAQRALAEATALGDGPLVDKATALVARVQALAAAFGK